MSNTDKRFLFLYPGESRNSRLQNLASGDVPREFFYGYLALAAAGAQCAIGDTRSDPTGRWQRALLKFEMLRNKAINLGLSRQRIDALAPTFARSDVAISFTDGFSVGMGLWARRYAPKVVLAGGFHGLADMIDKVHPAMRGYAAARVRQGLHGLDHLFFFGDADRTQSIARYALDPARTSVFPFGIDTEFWRPGYGESEPVVFAVGSDLQRDYPTLVAAPTDARMRLLTRLHVPPRRQGTYELIRGSWHNAAITDVVLRELYQSCAVVAVPLRDAWQPSGYSVTLQAMACGKPVVLSGIRGLWDPGVLRSGYDCMIVPPGDPAALARAIDALMGDAALRRRIGANARETVLANFPLARMDRAIVAMSERLAGASAAHLKG